MIIDGQTVVEILKIAVPLVLGLGGGMFAMFKYMNKQIGMIYKHMDAKFTRLEDILLNQNAKLNEMSGSNQTLEGCVFNSRAADERVKTEIGKLEEKLTERIDFESTRSKEGWNKLEQRITKLEEKVK